VVKSAQEPCDAAYFGVIFMPLREAENMFGMEGIINDITLSVSRTWIMQKY